MPCFCAIAIGKYWRGLPARCLKIPCACAIKLAFYNESPVQLAKGEAAANQLWGAGIYHLPHLFRMHS
jgi:hypothetical protein